MQVARKSREGTPAGSKEMGASDLQLQRIGFCLDEPGSREPPYQNPPWPVPGPRPSETSSKDPA